MCDNVVNRFTDAPKGNANHFPGGVFAENARCPKKAETEIEFKKTSGILKSGWCLKKYIQSRVASDNSPRPPDNRSYYPDPPLE